MHSLYFRACLFLLVLLGLFAPSMANADLGMPTNMSVNPVATAKYQIAWTPPPNSTANFVTLTNGSITYQIRTTSSTITTFFSRPGTWTIDVQGRTATELSPPASVTVNVSVPAPTTAPTGVVAKPQTGGIDLNWNPGAITDTLRISWVDPVTNQPRQLLTKSVFLALRGLQNNTPYTFSLAWTNSNGTGPATTISSTPLTTQLSVVTVPTATALSNTSAQVNWPSVPGATFYAIYAGPSADYAMLKATARPRITLSTSIVLSPITTGWYAFILPGNLNGLTQVIPDPIPLPTILPPTSAPTITATPGVLSAAIGWSTVPGATNYATYWNVGAFNQSIASMTTAATSPLVLTGLTANLQYNVAVRGTNAGGNGPLSTPATLTPFSAQTARSFQYLAGGYEHSLFLRPYGAIAAVGGNGYGQLGDGTTTQRLTPVNIPGISQMVAVAAGHHFSMALKDDGTVWTWGRNDYGQLGDGTLTQRTSPYQIPGLTNVIAISAGSNHAIALQANGTVWGWGSNQYNQINGSATATYLTPVQISGLPTIISIAAGAGGGMALQDNGTVWAWGANSSGNLGVGDTNFYANPVQVIGLTNIVSIAATGWHSLALKDDGTVWSWGWNGYGQIGDNTTTTRLAPVQTSGLSQIVEIAAGAAHCLALDATGQIWAWGLNHVGQVGDGTTTTPRLTPIKVYKNAKVSDMSRGVEMYHSMAMLNDWTVVTWGWGYYGQLANGYAGYNSSWPTPVSTSIFPPLPQMIVTSDSQQTVITYSPIPGATNYTLKYMPSPYQEGQAVSIPNVPPTVILPGNPAGTPYSYKVSGSNLAAPEESNALPMVELPASTYQVSSSSSGTFQVPSDMYNSQYAKLEGNPAFVPGGTGINPSCANDNSGYVYDWSIGPYPNANYMVLYFQGPPVANTVARIGSPSFSANNVVYGYYLCHIAGREGSATRVTS